jgi:hypothetical protein
VKGDSDEEDEVPYVPDKGLSVALSEVLQAAEVKKTEEVPRVKNPFEFPTLPVKQKKGKRTPSPPPAQIFFKPPEEEEMSESSDSFEGNLPPLRSEHYQRISIYDPIFHMIHPEIVTDLTVSVRRPYIKIINKRVLFEVHLVDVWSPDNFWFRFNDEALVLMTYQMQNYYGAIEDSSDLLIDPETLKVDLIVAAKLGDSWIRAKILALPDLNDEILVFLVDFGTTELVDISNLRYILKEFTEECGKALRGSLFGLKPKRDEYVWNAVTKQVFFNLVGNKKLFASIRFFDQDTEVSSLELFEKPSSWPGITNQMINLGFGEWGELDGSFPFAVLMPPVD